jgi:hypothetical protein
MKTKDKLPTYNFLLTQRYAGEAKKEQPKFNWSLLTTVIGLCITATSLFFTSKNIKDTEKWKKAEFIASQYEKFSQDTSVVFVSNFLDYFSRNIESNNTTINKDIAGFCLLPDSISGDADPKLKSQIRSYFDNYLEKLSLFNRYKNANVVNYADIKPYLKYQIKIIGRPAKEEHLREFQLALWDYIDRYDYKDVQDLCCSFGYNITPNKNINCISEENKDDIDNKPIYIEGIHNDKSENIELQTTQDTSR